MENPIKMDDLGVLLFLETPIWENISWQSLSSNAFSVKNEEPSSWHRGPGPSSPLRAVQQVPASFAGEKKKQCPKV